MTKPKQKEVTIFAHFKQGDDLKHIIRENPDMSHIGALYCWADMLEGSARSIRDAADTLCENSQEIEIYADTHHISLHNVDAKLYNKLKALGVVNICDPDCEE